MKEQDDTVVDEVLPVPEEEQGEEEQKQAAQEEVPSQEEMVPVKALQAERKKRQEYEQELAYYRQQQLQSQQQLTQEQEDLNDLLTKGDLNSFKQEFKRQVLEEAYAAQNPDLMERIKTELPEILSKPENKWLAESIAYADNRLARSRQILDMFAPKGPPPQRKAPDRQQQPRSPQTVGKTTSLSHSPDFMSMSDDELEQWRARRKRAG